MIEVAREPAPRSRLTSRGSGPHDFQHVVSALLQDRGYAKAIVSPPGADGGTDMLAFKDAL